MGFMGLDSWGESDNAAGLKYTIDKIMFGSDNDKWKDQYEMSDEDVAKLYAKKTAKQKEAIKKLLKKEIKGMANSYNTDGFVNIALLMEAGIIAKQDMYISTYKEMAKCFRKHIEWMELPNNYPAGDTHVVAYKRMLKFVESA